MKYTVILTEKEIYEVPVEADSESEASEKGYEAIETDEGKGMYHRDSDGEIEVIED